MTIKLLKNIKTRLVFNLKKLISLFLNPLEKRLTRQSVKDIQPVIFIIGAPRSGTSLLYELLIRQYKFAYISNLAQLMNRVPVSVSKIGLGLIEKYHDNKVDSYNSKYGALSGLGAPSEGGMVWSRWLAETHYLDESHLKNIDEVSLKGTILGFSNAMQGPFLNKNVMHSVHMRLLNVLFPECLFIHINREIKSNVRSILRAHSKFSTNKDEWFSVKPKEYKQYKNDDIVLRTVAQVHYIHENIYEDAKYLGEGRIFKIDYEKLCENPKLVIHSICTFLAKNGVELKERDSSIPNLSISAPNKLSEEIEKNISNYINEIKN